MGARLRLDYIVERDREVWAVRMRDGDGERGFPSRREALRAALKDADRVSGLGHLVQVLARRPDGSLRRVARRPSPADCGGR